MKDIFKNGRLPVILYNKVRSKKYYFVILLCLLFLYHPANKVSANSNRNIAIDEFDLVWKKELDKDLIQTVILPFNHELTTDEEESVYIKTRNGYLKYSDEGEFLYEVDADFAKVSNIVYFDNKIAFISSIYGKGYLYIYDSISGELLDKHSIFTEEEEEEYGGSRHSAFSEILLTENKKYIYFASNNIFKIFRYNIEEGVLESDYLKVRDRHYYIGSHGYPPVNLTEDSILLTSSKGYIQKFIHENLSNQIFVEYYNPEYVKGVATRYDPSIPAIVSDDFIFYVFEGKHICKFNKAEGFNIYCTKKRVTGGGFDYDSKSNIYFNKLDDGYFLTKFNSDLEEQWTKDWEGFKASPFFIDSLDNIIYSSRDLRLISSETGETLSTFELDAPEDSRHYKTSKATATKNNNYYVYVSYYKDRKKTAYLYKFKAKSKREVECPLDFYCDTKPEYNPVILVHGLGGHYKQWFDGKRAIVRDKILVEFKKEDPEYPDHWVFGYSYGIDFDGDYDYQGKIQDISDSMHAEVERLAKEHKMAGGDGKVDIVAYSLGGLVSRHYILEKTGYPNEENLNTDHKLNKLILIASPVNGSSWLKSIEDYYDGDKEKIKQARKVISDALTLKSGLEYDLNKDVGLQLSSQSSYITSVRNRVLPDNISYFRIHGDIMVNYKYNIFGKEIKRKLSIGDGVVLNRDTELNTNFTSSKRFKTGLDVNVKINLSDISLNFDTIDIGDSINILHTNILTYEENITEVLDYLTKD